jgi:NTE family protein
MNFALAKKSWCAALLVGVVLASGCATRLPTPPLGEYHPGRGYYRGAVERTNNSPGTLFFLALSGGGTRAAALSYGVLKELRDTPSPNHPGRTLLDEVDGISSVSGGSVTAAAYALHGERLFTDFEKQFLKRNVQRNLLWQTLNPLHWPYLWSGLAGPGPSYYDRILFQRATFDDLPLAARPFIVINATDVSTGARFEFTQAQFDLICGDVGRFPIARAVAASSAVPVALSPITLDNHGGACGYTRPEWMKNALSGSNSVPRRALFRAREMDSFGQAKERPYLHLVDGGVSDNLGLRAILDGFSATEAMSGESPENAAVRRVVILLVNAAHRPKRDWDRRPFPPGMFNLGAKSSSIPMSRYSYETVELLREKMVHWSALADQRRGQTNSMEFHLIEVSFDQLKDEQERAYFQNLKTSFNLPSADVDRLRDVGGRLLRESAEYQRLLQDAARRSQAPVLRGGEKDRAEQRGMGMAPPAGGCLVLCDQSKQNGHWAAMSSGWRGKQQTNKTYEF